MLTLLLVPSSVKLLVPTVRIPSTLAPPSTIRVVLPYPIVTVPAAPADILPTPTALIPPAAISTPPAFTLIPDLAVIRPTESTLVTSCLVNVPPTETSPLKVPFTAVRLPPANILPSRPNQPSSTRDPVSLLVD